MYICIILVNNEFVLSVIKNKFKSSDLGSTKQFLLHEFPKSTSTILYHKSVINITLLLSLYNIILTKTTSL